MYIVVPQSYRDNKESKWGGQRYGHVKGRLDHEVNDEIIRTTEFDTIGVARVSWEQDIDGFSVVVFPENTSTELDEGELETLKSELQKSPFILDKNQSKRNVFNVVGYQT